MKNDQFFKTASLSSVGLWLGLFSLIPLTLLFIISFLDHTTTHIIRWNFTWINYQQLFNPIFFRILIQSLELAVVCTFLCLIIGYPAAFIIAHSPEKYKSFLMLLMIIPFWTSSLIRTYAILTILKAKGLLNIVLLYLGIIHHPMHLLYTNTAVVIGIVYNLLPYMILPLYANIEKLDHTLFDAARDLGASRFKIFVSITLPLTMPGIIAGTILVFLPAITLFYIPDILGGAKSLLLGNLVENQFLSMNDWPGGCATSIVLTLLMLLLMMLYRRAQRDNKVEGLL